MSPWQRVRPGNCVEQTVTEFHVKFKKKYCMLFRNKVSDSSWCRWLLSVCTITLVTKTRLPFSQGRPPTNVYIKLSSYIPLFASVTLTLTWYELDLDILEMCHTPKTKFLCHSFQKSKHEQDGQTQRRDRTHYQPGGNDLTCLILKNVFFILYFNAWQMVVFVLGKLCLRW